MIEIINMSDLVNEETFTQPNREKPNKLKQIGQPENRKLYIEDYVYTYLYQIAAANEDKEAMAILLGSIENQDTEINVYTEGAIEIKYHLVDNNSITFTEETWSDIHEKINHFFPGKKIIGWFMSQPGYGAVLNEIIYKTHSDNFSESGQALFMVDRIEKEESYYSYENGMLKKQSGYYIFYERNQAMQDFMIETREAKKPEFEDFEPIIENYRKVENNKKEENYQQKIVGLLYATSTALAVVVLVIGIVMLNNYDKMKQMEDAMRTINNNIGNKGNPDVSQVFNPDDNEDDDDRVNTNTSTHENNNSNNNEKDPESTTTTTQEKPITKPSEEDIDITTPTVEEKDDKTEEQPTVTVTQEEPASNIKEEPAPIYTKYKVKEGDTLVDIVYNHYKNLKKLDEVQRINNIDNRDKIYVGDIILLP